MQKEIDKPQSTDLVAVMQNARAEVRMHLRALAIEILGWRDTGSLQDGRLRQIAMPLKLISVHDHLGLAEKLVVDAALEAASEKR